MDRIKTGFKIIGLLISRCFFRSNPTSKEDKKNHESSLNIELNFLVDGRKYRAHFFKNMFVVK